MKECLEEIDNFEYFYKEIHACMIKLLIFAACGINPISFGPS